MPVWALVSRRGRETVELYLDEATARAALEDVLVDEPELWMVLEIVELDWRHGAEASGTHLN